MLREERVLQDKLWLIRHKMQDRAEELDTRLFHEGVRSDNRRFDRVMELCRAEYAEAHPEEREAELAAAEAVAAARVTPDQITGTGSWQQIVAWVSRNLYRREPDPQTCPDPRAWLLWMEYRGDPKAFVREFLSKSFKGEDAASNDRFTDDGRSVLKLLGRIRNARDEAIRRSRERAAAAG